MTQAAHGDFYSYLANAVAVRLAAEAAVVERACEAALQGGEYGVLRWRGRAWVDPRVPYGWVYDVSAMDSDALEDWSP